MHRNVRRTDNSRQTNHLVFMVDFNCFAALNPQVSAIQDLDDLAAMAQDTIGGVGGFTPSRNQVEAARRTIAEIQKEKSSCPSTAKKS